MRIAYSTPLTHLVDGDLLPRQGLPGRRQAAGPHQRLELGAQRIHRLEHILHQDGQPCGFNGLLLTAASPDSLAELRGPVLQPRPSTGTYRAAGQTSHAD